jgi:hypothetical protein
VRQAKVTLEIRTTAGPWRVTQWELIGSPGLRSWIETSRTIEDVNRQIDLSGGGPRSECRRHITHPTKRWIPASRTDRYAHPIWGSTHPMPQGAHTRPGRSAGGSPSLSRAWRRAPHGPACDAIRRCTGHHSIPVARRSTGPRPSASPLAANRSPPVAGQTLSAYRVMWWRNWTGSCPTQQNVSLCQRPRKAAG